MHHLPPVRAIAIDVLGTLVDEPAALRATIAAMIVAAPASDPGAVESHRARWEGLIAVEQGRIARGERPYADADLLDAEAARDLLRRIGGSDARARASTVGDRLTPWPDAAAGIRLLARRHPVFGLSNATTTTLNALARRADLAWTRALSAADARAYKPAPEVYRLASDAAGVAPHDVLMVAAHAWDLRAAQAVGMRTAYVRRPVGDPPRPDDAFDGEFDTIAELADALAG